MAPTWTRSALRKRFSISISGSLRTRELQSARAPRSLPLREDVLHRSANEPLEGTDSVAEVGRLLSLGRLSDHASAGAESDESTAASQSAVLSKSERDRNVRRSAVGDLVDEDIDTTVTGCSNLRSGTKSISSHSPSPSPPASPIRNSRGVLQRFLHVNSPWIRTVRYLHATSSTISSCPVYTVIQTSSDVPRPITLVILF